MGLSHTKILQSRVKRYVWAIEPHFSQPFTTGHLQGPVVSQASPVEVVPIGQGQTYAEGFFLAVKRTAVGKMINAQLWKGESG